MRNGYEDGKLGAASMAETTCVILRSANWATSLAVARQVRYRRGAILLASLLATRLADAERSLIVGEIEKVSILIEREATSRV